MTHPAGTEGIPPARFSPHFTDNIRPSTRKREWPQEA